MITTLRNDHGRQCEPPHPPLGLSAAPLAAKVAVGTPWHSFEAAQGPGLPSAPGGEGMRLGGAITVATGAVQAAAAPSQLPDPCVQDRDHPRMHQDPRVMPERLKHGGGAGAEVCGRVLRRRSPPAGTACQLPRYSPCPCKTRLVLYPPQRLCPSIIWIFFPAFHYLTLCGRARRFRVPGVWSSQAPPVCVHNCQTPPFALLPTLTLRTLMSWQPWHPRG